MTWLAKAAVTVALTIWVLSLALSVIDVLILVLMAAVLAIGLDPAVRWLERKNMRRGHAVAIIFGGAVLLTVLFVWIVIPPLVRQMNGLSNDIPTYAQRLERRDDAIGRYVREHAVVQSLKDFVADLPSRVVSSFSQILGVAGKVTSAVFNFTTVAILTLYLLLSLPSLKKSSAMMVSKGWRERTTQVADQAVAKIGGFVSGNILTALICALVTLIALAVFRVPYAIPLAMWAGVADLIPAVGSYLGAIPAVAIALFQTPLTAVLVVAYFIAYQQFENFYLVPKVMRNAVDLSPATVITAMLIGSRLFGFAGALLALPVAATIKVILHDVWLHARSEEGDALVLDEVHAEEGAKEKAAQL